MIRSMLIAVVFGLLITLPAGAAPAPTPKGEKPALTVSIAVPLNHGRRSIYLGKEGVRDSVFHVVVTNNSDKDINLWREWCSWGYYNLSFEADLDGKVVKLKKLPHDWDKNYPDSQTLKPGDHYVIPVKLTSAEWDLPVGKGEANKPRDFKMRAIFNNEGDAETAKSQVWTGKIESAWETYSFWGQP